jgi:hypothetical protein
VPGSQKGCHKIQPVHSVIKFSRGRPANRVSILTCQEAEQSAKLAISPYRVETVEVGPDQTSVCQFHITLNHFRLLLPHTIRVNSVLPVMVLYCTLFSDICLAYLALCIWDLPPYWQPLFSPLSSGPLCGTIPIKKQSTPLTCFCKILDKLWL